MSLQSLLCSGIYKLPTVSLIASLHKVNILSKLKCKLPPRSGSGLETVESHPHYFIKQKNNTLGVLGLQNVLLIKIQFSFKIELIHLIQDGVFTTVIRQQKWPEISRVNCRNKTSHRKYNIPYTLKAEGAENQLDSCLSFGNISSRS